MGGGNVEKVICFNDLPETGNVRDRPYRDQEGVTTVDKARSSWFERVSAMNWRLDEVMSGHQ
jgi:hypothetical protein